MAYVQTRTNAKGEKHFTATVSLRGHPSESRTFSTKTAARRWGAKREDELRGGEAVAGREAMRHTLAEAIARYCETELPTRGAAMRRDSPRYLDWWETHYGEYSLAAMTPALLVEARDRLRKTPKRCRKKACIAGVPQCRDAKACAAQRGTLSEASIYQYRAAISDVFRVADEDWHWMARPRLPRLRVNNARRRFLNDESPEEGENLSEFDRLVQACRESESAHLYVAFWLAVSTGARRAEIMGLRRRNVSLADRERATVTFLETKNGEPRTVAIPAMVVDLLREHIRTQARPGSDLIFPGRGKDPNTPADLKAAWSTARSPAGFQVA